MKLTGRPHVSLAGGVLSALLLGSAGAMLAGPTLGSHLPPNAPDTVEPSARVLDRGIWRLEALVLDEYGAAVVDGPVGFSAEVDFLGARRIALGEARTDVAGQAALSYRPTWNGTHHLVAEALRTDGTSVVARFTLVAEGVAPPIPPDERALPFTGSWALPAGLLLVGGVWLVLGFIFITTVIGIGRARVKGAPSASGPADLAKREPAALGAVGPSDRR